MLVALYRLVATGKLVVDGFVKMIILALSTLEKDADMNIYSEFAFFDDTYSARDGFDQSVMDIHTGKVYGLSDDNRATYLHTQKFKADMKGCINAPEYDRACILDFDGKQGIWEY